MPIYEFYCEACNTIFNFFSKSADTSKRPLCPQCKTLKLKRYLSSFSVQRKGQQEENGDVPSFDEGRMEKAIGLLAHKAEHIDENDPKQAAQLMRTFSEMTGLSMGKGMEEVIERMEAGEDPERLEEDMGDIDEGELFSSPGRKAVKERPPLPLRDETLYEL